MSRTYPPAAGIASEDIARALLNTPPGDSMTPPRPAAIVNSPSQVLAQPPRPFDTPSGATWIPS